MQYSTELNIALTPLTKSQTFKFGVWDVEARNWWDLLVIGCFDGEAYYQFRKVEDFVSFVLQKKYRYWRWFAHFGGRYDLNFIFDWLREQRPDIGCSFYCSGSMVLQMTIRRGQMVAKFCDSYRLLQASLRDLGIAFDVKHKKTEIEFEEMTYNRQLLEYNEQDCRCLYEVLVRFFEETGITSETFATHALRVFRKDFLKEKIWKPHQHILDFCRESYHGGHVEVFKRKGVGLNAFDVNSMYPYVMQQPVPVRYLGESRKIVTHSYGFVKCVVRIPEQYIPPLPYRLEKLYFPSGSLTGVWSIDELVAAEERGAKIQKVLQSYYFDTSPVFRDYATTLYALKKKSAEPTRTIAKLLMNSLYGKFGQQPVKRIYTTEREAPNGSYPILNGNGEPSGFAYYERRSHSAYLLPHIAASITSKARMVLLSSLNERSYYCDTDSVFTSDTLRTGKELGDWSLVGTGDCTFIQPKLYKFKGEWKAKGLDKKQDIDGFVFEGKVNHIMRRRSIKEALNDGGKACADVEVDKLLRETRPKRAWIGDDTRPWTIDELLQRS